MRDDSLSTLLISAFCPAPPPLPDVSSSDIPMDTPCLFCLIPAVADMSGNLVSGGVIIRRQVRALVPADTLLGCRVDLRRGSTALVTDSAAVLDGAQKVNEQMS